MTSNQDLLVDVAKLQTLADCTCNTCCHNQSGSCHNPKLDPDAEDGWPGVDGSTVCEWYREQTGKR